MKIVLAYDGSPSSDAALEEVARRPWPAQTAVRILLVDPPLDSSRFPGTAPTVFDELVQRQRAAAVDRLTAAAAALRAKAPNLAVTPLLRDGSPRDVILDEASEWPADLIVLGSHGYGAVRRLFLGSVSLAIAANAPCSVQIVRGSIPPQPASA